MRSDEENRSTLKVEWTSQKLLLRPDVHLNEGLRCLPVVAVPAHSSVGHDRHRCSFSLDKSVHFQDPHRCPNRECPLGCLQFSDRHRSVSCPLASVYFY